jgi:hypothetical protein
LGHGGAGGHGATKREEPGTGQLGELHAISLRVKGD